MFHYLTVAVTVVDAVGFNLVPAIPTVADAIAQRVDVEAVGSSDVRVVVGTLVVGSE